MCWLQKRKPDNILLRSIVKYLRHYNYRILWTSYAMLQTNFTMYTNILRTNVKEFNNPDEQTRCKNDLLIYKISSTCFGQYFAHHQEGETAIFTAYGILLLWWAGRR